MIKDRLFLKKVFDSYVLHRIKDGILTIEGDSHYTIGGIEPFYKLSISNCKSIEFGYDLDELAKEYMKISSIEFDAFKSGFQKALSILGDKKFSEDDVISMIEKSRETGLTAEYLILTKQQTEWEVEIEMIFPHPMDTYRCGLKYGCDEDGCNHPKQIPYLDADGCLILKRK